MNRATLLRAALCADYYQSMVCPRAIRLFRSQILVVLLLANVLLLAGAQEGVFAPFVSRIRLAIRDPQVRVTWEDAASLETSYAVYRAREPITTGTLPDATLLGTVASGEEAYLDVPPEPGEYYYAVVARGPDGEAYPAIIPGRNASFRPVEIASVATPAERAANITDLSASVVSAEGQSAVEITAVSDREGRSLAVYRSTEPILSVDDLARASLVREVASAEARLIDLPVPGVEYFYAMVDAGLLIAGEAVVNPGENATREPVEIPIVIAGAAAEPTATPSAEAEPASQAPGSRPEPVRIPEPDPPSARAVPLPFLQLQSVLATGRRLQDPRIRIPDPAPLAEGIEERVASLIGTLGSAEQPELDLTILEDDRGPEPEGAEYTLRTILDGPMAQMAWETALAQLENYFTLPLTPDLAARAHFYRGQAYSFLGDRRRAILEFLLARDRYYVQAERWLDLLLQRSGT